MSGQIMSVLSLQCVTAESCCFKFEFVHMCWGHSSDYSAAS